MYGGRNAVDLLSTCSETKFEWLQGYGYVPLGGRSAIAGQNKYTIQFRL